MVIMGPALVADIIDVFGSGAFSGNPLAVIHGAEALTTEQMQAITSWLNFSETTFLLAPTSPAADYRVRIFTLNRELPFAGHPTLGTAHAWLRAGNAPKTRGTLIQECPAGLIELRQSENSLAFAAPPLLRSGNLAPEHITKIAAFLNIDVSAIKAAQHVDNGPGWVAVLLESAAAVLAVKPAASYPGGIDLGVVGPHPAGSPAAWELRAFFSTGANTVAEDPVTGSLNASVAQWLLGSGRATAPYMAAQGTVLGRRGRVRISQSADGKIWVGGATVTIFSGRLEALPLMVPGD